MTNILVPVPLPVPEDEEVLTVYALRRQPSGDYTLERHPVVGARQADPMGEAKLLRFLADRMDIEGLPTATDPRDLPDVSQTG